MPSWKRQAKASAELIDRMLEERRRELLGEELEELEDELEELERPETVLEEASRLVDGPRQAIYGHPLDDFTRTAGLWSSYLGFEVAPQDVALMMVLLKVSRLRATPRHRDSMVDGPGYFRTYELVFERLEELELDVARGDLGGTD